MVAKELLDARWRATIGGLLALLVAAAITASYDWIRGLLASVDLSQLPAGVSGQLQQGLGLFDEFAWGQWFAKNGPMVLGGLAAFLGGTLVAGEVSKGTIFFLLSKPLSRGRVLAIKYAVGAGLLLAACLLGSLGILAAATVLGHPQALGGLLLSTLLIWLGALSIFGLALLFSVLFDDLLRPVGLAILIGILLGVPGLIGAFAPAWAAWSLPNYWASFPAYMATGFPARELAICLVAAVVPAALALALFRRRAY